MERLSFFLFLTIFLLVSFLICVIPLDYLLHFSLDDAYFYYKTALNYASGAGSTFDGINTTNGYHPLWFFVLSTYYSVLLKLDIDDVAYIFRATLILSTLLNMGGLYFIYRILEVYLNKTFRLSAFIVISTFLVMLAMFHVMGLEIHLLIFFLSLYYYFIAVEESGRENRLILRATIVGLITVTRLDLILLLFPAIIITEIIFLNKVYKSKKITPVFIFIVIAIIPFILFILYNFITFGHISTTS